MGKDMIAGGAVLGAIIIVIMGAILGVGVNLQYWATMNEVKALTLAIGIMYYQHYGVNIYISIVICAVAGLLAGATAKGPLYGLLAGIGAYIGSLIGILIVAGAVSTIIPPLFGQFGFRIEDFAAVVGNSFIWGVWAVIGMAFIGGALNKESETRG